jgi:hypothetical protein
MAGDLDDDGGVGFFGEGAVGGEHGGPFETTEGAETTMLSADYRDLRKLRGGWWC